MKSEEYFVRYTRPVNEVLRARGDRHRAGSAFNFLRRLHQHTYRTTTSGQQIIQERTVDSFLLTNLGSDLRHEEEVGERNKRRQAAEQAVVSNRLGVLTGGITVTEVGNEACTTVIEAAKQSVRPLSCHSGSKYAKFSEIKQIERSNAASQFRFQARPNVVFGDSALENTSHLFAGYVV